MIADLEKKCINVCAVVTDSAGAYAAARYLSSIYFFICIILFLLIIL